jgi:predicted RNase H-like HicB family nuclease
MKGRPAQLTAVIEREGNGFVATCPELDIVSEGESIEAARSNLLEAVEGFFEAASPSEIKRRLKKDTYVMPLMPVIPAAKSSINA